MTPFMQEGKAGRSVLVQFEIWAGGLGAWFLRLCRNITTSMMKNQVKVKIENAMDIGHIQ